MTLLEVPGEVEHAAQARGHLKAPDVRDGARGRCDPCSRRTRGASDQLTSLMILVAHALYFATIPVGAEDRSPNRPSRQA